MKEFFVAENGSDQNEGSISAPLANLAGARNRIREFRGNLSEDNVAIIVLPGEYSVYNRFDTKQKVRLPYTR